MLCCVIAKPLLRLSKATKLDCVFETSRLLQMSTSGVLGTIPHVEALQRQISGAPFKYKQLDKDSEINLLHVAHLLHITLKMVVCL